MPRYEDDDEDRPRRRRRDENDDADEEIAADTKPGNGMAVTSMILGIVGFCVLGICGLLAILFGFLGLAKSKETGTGKSMATTGIILGVINGIILPIFVGVLIYRGVLWTGKKVEQAAEGTKEWAKKVEEENKAWQKQAMEDQKIIGEVNTARQQMLVLEKACKAYTLKSGGNPPPTLDELIAPSDGGRPFVTGGKSVLNDPWGKAYQYDATNTTPIGDPDPLVFTLHPRDNVKIYAFGRNK